MKTTLITLFCLCLPLAGTEKKTDVEEDGYKGRVKSVKDSTFNIEVKDGKPVKKNLPFRSNTTKYDEKGNKAEKVEYIRKTIFKYDEKGNKVEQVLHDASGKINRKYTYKHDEKGNKKEKAFHVASGNIRSKHTYKYDEKGNKKEKVYHDASGKIDLKRTLKYDEKGNKVKEKSFREETANGEIRFVPLESRLGNSPTGTDHANEPT